ncbi:anthrone oxygenase family protein [Kitasatospora sp. NPDC054939]
MRSVSTTPDSPANPLPSTAQPAPGGPTGRAAGPVLIGATVATGLMAGLLFAFYVSVMPGLAEGDDRTYVTAMQNINRVIENAVFGLVFVGAFAAIAVAAWLEHRAGRRAVVRWVGAALLLYAVMLGLTAGVNVPLNTELADAGDPSTIADLAAVRARFEDTWVVSNAVRTLVCTAALGALGRALLLHGRLSR